MKPLWNTLFPLTLGFLLFLSLPKIESKTMGALLIHNPDSTFSHNVGIIPIIENVGQFGTGALFQSDSELGTMFVAKDALWLTILEPSPVIAERDLFDATAQAGARRGVHLRLSFVGSNPTPTIEVSDPLTSSINYLRGNDPEQWHTDVPVWGAVRYVDLYPGIDLELSSRDGLPVRRFIVRDPLRANIQSIALQVEGANAIAVSENGIEITTDFGKYTFPFFEMTEVGREGGVPNPAQVSADTIHFPIRASDVRTLSPMGDNLLLPSNLYYSTLLGGSEIDNGLAVTVDQQGAIVVAGYTESFNFPTTPGAFDPTTTGYYARNGFITKFNESGTALDYSTYIDSGNTTRVHAIAVDGNGQVYAAGYTRGDDFPTTPNSPTPGFGGVIDGFVLKLTPTGNALVYSLLLGGEKGDYVQDMTLLSDGSVIVTGVASGLGFPVTLGAYDTNNSIERITAFVTRVAPDGSSLVYSTLLGGSFGADGYGIAVDSSGNAYVMGTTDSNDFPTTPGAYDSTPISLLQYFVTKFTPDGSDLVYSTVVNGMSAPLLRHDIAVDQYGAAYVATHVYNPSFLATPSAYDTECGYNGIGCGNPQNSTDGVLFKLNPAGSEMVYGTYLGGSGTDDSARQLVVDDDGNAYVVGIMDSPEVQISIGAYNYPNSGGAIWKINADGTELLQLSRCYSGLALAIEADDVALCAGYSYGDYETTTNGYDTTYNGAADVTVARILMPDPATTATLSVSGGVLTSPIDGTTYNFPANVFTETVVFTHAPRHPLSLPPVAPRVTIGHTFVNYAIGSNSALQPRHPYTLQIEYDAGNFSIDETTLELFFWNGMGWEAEPTAILNPTNNLITATPDRLGWWAVTGASHRRYLPSVKR